MNNHIYLQLISLNKTNNNHFLKRYVKLVSFFKQRNWSYNFGLHEHHIIPESFGGLDTNDNLVFITIREHFILHWMLYKSFPQSSMVTAFNMMCHCWGQKVSSKVYEKLQIENIERQRKTQNKKVEEGTHHLLDGKIQKESNRKRLENGTHTSQIKKMCPHCNKTINISNFAQWHGNKCKLNPLFIDESTPKLKKLCPHCKKEFYIANFAQYHGDKCKLNPLYKNEMKHKHKPHKKHKHPPKVECPHCNQYVSKSMFTRWHGNNCKLNPLYKNESKPKPKIECSHCKGTFSKTNFIRWHGDKCKLKQE